MTRINLVPPEELTDQHLFAEFREIKMIPKSLARSYAAALRNNDGSEYKARIAVLDKVPAEFCLGKGHVSFFYNKGVYLIQRYALIRRELDKRGVRYSKDSAFDPELMMWEHPWHGFYTPREADLKLVRARIAERIAFRPGWYRRYGVPV